MEYKYEIVVDHPLEIPHQLKLDADFADVIGKSLQVGLQMGYADETIDLEPLPQTDQRNIERLSEFSDIWLEAQFSDIWLEAQSQGVD